MNAVRVETRAGWVPVTRHYEVPGGFLAVTVLSFGTASGTSVFLVDENGVAVGDHVEAIATFPEGTSHDDALEQLGYTVRDDVGPEPSEPDAVEDPPVMVQSVMELLPPEIASALGQATT